MRVFLSAAAVLMCAAAPASAQVFWASPDVSGAALIPGDVGVGIGLPGATVAEERANWAWQMRAALNVAALQCGFDKTLLAADSYNGILRNHSEELSGSYNALRGYFARINKKPKDAQNALDKFGTKTYSSFSTVSSQYGFCQAASRIGKAAQFAARGSFTLFTIERLRELRNSLIPAGDQFFRRSRLPFAASMVSFDPGCWDRRGRYNGRCGEVYI